ncbi:uncharacterized protein [Penaeus vannamei]|uniref:uncharacterized protein n=1 Tax=Penaeus vannamei TaxID=6689 RepID=UPI00387F84BC
MAATTATTRFGDDRVTLDYALVQHIASKDSEYQLLMSLSARDWHQHRAQEMDCLRHFYKVQVTRNLTACFRGQGRQYTGLEWKVTCSSTMMLVTPATRMLHLKQPNL